MKTILITGGAGFLGSNLCYELIKNKENRIICVDNLYTGRLENIKGLMEPEYLDRFCFIKHDIRKPLSINSMCKVDEIYNLACPASPVHYQGLHSIETTETCVLGSINMLNFAKDSNAKILFSSTSEVYGEPLEHPQKEDYRGNVNCTGVRACYDEGKRCAESLFFDYNRIYGVDVKVIRIFNTYGPLMRKDDGRVVSNFINQALMEKDITIYGDGSQTRSFCYVDDLIKGIIKMMGSKLKGPINLGNPEEYTVKELAEIIINITGSHSGIVYKDLPSDDPTQRKPNIEMAKFHLDWKPKIQIEDGIKKTIDYFKEIIND